MSKTELGKNYHHGDLRRALLKAAWALLRKQGLKQLTLRAVARKVGVTHAAPYHHFADREALLDAMAAEAFAEFDRALGEATAGVEPSEELLVLGRAYIDFARAKPECMEVMFRRADGRADKSLLEQGACAFQHLVDALAARQRAGSAPVGDVQALALAAWSLVHGFSVLWVEGPLGMMASDEGNFELLRDTMLRSYGAGLEATAKLERAAELGGGP